MNVVNKIKEAFRVLSGHDICFSGDPYPVMNINYKPWTKQKKILVSYLDLKHSSWDLQRQQMNVSGTIHTNRAELFAIISALIELDYCIDVVLHGDVWGFEKVLKNRDYDVIFGLGNVFRRAVEVFPNAYNIIYMTENPYYISYKREMERIQYFKQRHGVEYPIYRTGMFFKDGEENKADAIICLGDEKPFLERSLKTERLFPTAFIPNNKMDYSKRKKNTFVVFGTDGMIHKGVDIVFEVFERHPEWELYLCGHDVTKGLKELGYKHIPSNIQDKGYLVPKTEEFNKVMEEASYVILISCSEATATGVLTCMAHGMIPIVTKGNGFEHFGDLCVFCDTYSIEAVEDTIKNTILKNVDNCLPKFMKVEDFAAKEFSLESFQKNFKKAFEKTM